MQYTNHTPNLFIRIREHLLNVCYILAFVGYSTFKRKTGIPQVGVRALVVRGDEVLLIRHRLFFFGWSLPGGTVGRHENLEETVRREVEEEAGCMVRVERLHGVFRNIRRGANIHTFVFICTPLSEPRPPVADLEIVDACYVPLHALPAQLEMGSRQRIEEYQRGEHSIAAAWRTATADDEE